MNNEKIIYLDNSATTRPSDASLTKMREALSVSFANPGSVHKAGNEAHRLLEEARSIIGLTLGVRRPQDGSIIFTSSGSEANNLAIFGSIRAKDRPMKGDSRGSVLISDSEHPSVSRTAESLEAEGFRIIRVPTAGGVLDLDFIKDHCDSSCVLASFMLVNNETGALYDVESAARIVRQNAPKAFIHSDCVQAYLKTRFTSKALGVDALTVSAHKINAPKGAGALYITADVIKGRRLVPTTLGGGQENGFRSGTENVPAICAFSAAAREGFGAMTDRQEKTARLRRLFEESIDQSVQINRPEKGICPIISITLPNIKSETMLNFLSGKGICISAGSACSARSKGPSSVLTAFGLSREDADCSLRISPNHENSDEDILLLCDALKEGILSLAKIKA